MASKKPTKKAPAKKAPAPKKTSVKVVKKVVKPAAKKAPLKSLKSVKVIKPVKKSSSKAAIKTPALKKKAPSASKKPAAKSSRNPLKGVHPAKKAPAKPVQAVSKPSRSKVKGKAPLSSNHRVLAQQFVKKPKVNKNLKLTPFLTKQRQRLLELKDTLLDAMRGVARDNLHSGSDTSAFGMHQADAGSDAYDRDFALSMLSKEQGSLYEIDEALKRIEDGTYGVCDLCQKPIKHERLEALPFTRYTVDCQAGLEKNQHHNSARPQITSLFGLTEEESENEEEDTTEIS